MIGFSRFFTTFTDLRLNYNFEKHFTLSQANAMLPHIRRLFAEVNALLIGADGSHISSPEKTKSRKHSANGNGNGHSNGNGNGNGHGKEKGASQVTDYSGWSDEKRHEAAYRLVNALQTQGIVIQDVERGLIDFPCLMDGREVFLCYELNDGFTVGYFHELDTGYAGRQEITENNHE